MNRRLGAGLGALFLAPTAIVATHAEIYLTESQAAAVLFPGVKFAAAQTTQNVRFFCGPKGEALYIDKVVGKHDFITYAVGINPDGKVRGVEILEYRESYGYQVRDEAWRKQFVGKDKSSAIRVDKDIKNISGATLSSVHVTDGVRKIVQLHEKLASAAKTV